MHKMKTYKTISQACQCCLPGYKNAAVFAIVRCSASMIYVFHDGSTLTDAPKTRVATFPSNRLLTDLVDDACSALNAKHPRTINRYITFNT